MDPMPEQLKVNMSQYEDSKFIDLRISAENVIDDSDNQQSVVTDSAALMTERTENTIWEEQSMNHSMQTNSTIYEIMQLAKFYQERNLSRKERGLFELFPSSYNPRLEEDDYEEEDLPEVYEPYLPP